MQILRQNADTLDLQLRRRQLVEIHVMRLAGIQILFDAIQTGGDHGGSGQIGIAAAIGRRSSDGHPGMRTMEDRLLSP